MKGGFMDFTALCGELSVSLASTDVPIERYALITGCLGGYFAVEADEISLFLLDKDRNMLVFTWPRGVKIMGNIPIDAGNCLVARTASTRETSIDNRFASTPHLFIYEHFVSGRPGSLPIQKIMSVPVVSGNELKGVIQVGRKGVDLESAGADFSEKNLEDLSAFAALFAQYL